MEATAGFAALRAFFFPFYLELASGLTVNEKALAQADHDKRMMELGFAFFLGLLIFLFGYFCKPKTEL